MSDCCLTIHNRSTPSTHLPLAPHICVRELGQHWFRKWLVTCSAPSHYLDQWWLVVNLTHRKKIQWNLNQNIQFLIHANIFENALCKMAAILSKGKWVSAHVIQLPARQNRNTSAPFSVLAASTSIRDNKVTLYGLPLWYRADSRFAPSQWEVALLCNAISHWLGANLESTLWYIRVME